MPRLACTASMLNVAKKNAASNSVSPAAKSSRPPTFRQKSSGAGQPDALAATGDDNDLTLETQIHDTILPGETKIS